MKKYLFSFLMLVPMLTMAQSFTSDNLQYWVISNVEMTAEVIGLSAGMPNFLNIPNTVTYNGASYKVVSIREGAFSKCSAEESSKLYTVIVGNNVTELPQFFMRDKPKLNTVVLGSGLKKIGAMAFFNCTSLVDIAIPDGVNAMDGSIFTYCSKLKNVKLSKSMTQASLGLFNDCPNLETIDFGGSNYTYIGSIFRGTYPNLMRITIRNAAPPETSKDAFPADVVKNTYLHVPEGCAQAYKDNAAYQNFKGIIDDITDAQCADPVIQVSGGIVRFTCATPGVTYKYTANAQGEDAGTTSGACQISEPYVFISVQATKSGCDPSNIVTKPVPCSALFASSHVNTDVNGDGKVNTTDVVEIYNYIINGN